MNAKKSMILGCACRVCHDGYRGRTPGHQDPGAQPLQSLLPQQLREERPKILHVDLFLLSASK